MRLWPFGSKSKRVFVLGLDGVPQTLMQDFLQRGIMPNLARLLAGRRLAQMDSCYPCVSNVAWSCFQTGKDPSGFGIYGFAELTPDFEVTIPDASDLKSRTIWEILSENGKRVIALGVPLTHPAREVNGIIVGGFTSPGMDRAVYPSNMTAKFKGWGYRLDIDPSKARESIDHLRQDLIECLDGRARTLKELRGEPWDLFVLHVMETDRINHFMWRFMEEEPESDNGRFFIDFYKRVDEFIGLAMEGMDDAEFILLSDHGFCRVKNEVQVNRWLEKKGFLSYSDEPAKGFMAISNESKALALVPGRIQILREGRWARGGVKADQYSAVRDEVIAALKNWKDDADGQPICNKVFKREEIFNGSHAANAPDIIIHPRDGYDLKAALGPGDIFTHSPLNGMHTHHDAMLFIRGRDLHGPKPIIWDLAPTILHMLGVTPEGMDGRILD